MSEAKHTAGHWETWPNFDDFGEEDGLTIIGIDDTPLFCSVRDTNTKDISLAAAAPELLESLEGLLSEVKHLEQDYPEDYNFKPYHDAITKAKGLPK